MKYLAFALAGSALMAAPALAQDKATPGATVGGPEASTQQAAPAGQAPAAAGQAPNVAVGAKVADTSGAEVGTIEAVNGGNAIISTGTAKASIPVSSFAKGPNGLVVGITKADLEAAVAKASAPAEIAVGAPVSDNKGGAVGKVAAVAGDLITVETPNAKAQLPRTAFAQGPQGLIIGMTAAQLEQAAKAAGGAQGS